MNEQLAPEYEVERYRLEIRDESGKLIRIEEFDRRTGEVRITDVTE